MSALHDRRSASPIRLTLASQLGGDLDGAWWPQTPSEARELPDLIDALREPLGEVIDIAVNWSPLDGVPDLDSLSRIAAIPGHQVRQVRCDDRYRPSSAGKTPGHPAADQQGAGCDGAASGGRPADPAHAPRHRGMPSGRRHRVCRARSRRAARQGCDHFGLRQRLASHLFLEGVFYLLTGIFEVGLRLIAPALVAGLSVTGDIAERFLRLTAEVLRLVLGLIRCAHYVIS